MSKTAELHRADLEKEQNVQFDDAPSPLQYRRFDLIDFAVVIVSAFALGGVIYAIVNR